MITNQIEFREYLFTFQDLQYKEFHQKISTVDNLIGIRNNILRTIAKKIAKNDYKKYFAFFENIESSLYYEEIMIYGLVIGYLKIPFIEKLNYLERFLPFIDNWAICDSVCTTLKDFKKNDELGYQFISKILKSDKIFSVRFAYVLLLSYYINDKYIDDILDIINKNKLSSYYIDMAIAWLISFCYIKYPDKTFVLLEMKTLPKFIHNKAISKICDSYQVLKFDKEKLKQYRIK